MNWTVSPANGAKVTLAMSESDVSGPLQDKTSSYRYKLFRFADDGTGTFRGISDYGVTIAENVPNNGNPNALTLSIPEIQRLAQVFVVGGVNTPFTGGGGGGGGGTTLQGDVFQIGQGSDRLELRESVGKVSDTVTETDLTGLKGGRITTSEGSTEYHQYLRLKDGNSLQNIAVNFGQNDSNKTADFLVIASAEPFLEWEIQFPDGLASKMVAPGGTSELKDIQDRTFNIMGTDYNIVRANHELGTANALLLLLGGSVPDTLRQGETKTYTINGKDYEVTLTTVNNGTGGSGPTVEFSVNGMITPLLMVGSTYSFPDGMLIGVRDILLNAREGVASFFLGANKIVITDTDVTNTAWDGQVELNNHNIPGSSADIQGVESGNNFKITSIKYRLLMDENGTTAYIPAGHGLRESMAHPEALLSSTLDLQYAGLTSPVAKNFSLVARSDDSYRLMFTNILGKFYDVPFVSNRGVFKYGDENHELVFTENMAVFRNDYFIVTFGGVSVDRAPTSVLRYTGFDIVSLTASFEDVADGTSFIVPVNSSGVGDLLVEGHTYKIVTSDITQKDSNITIDLNGDGNIDANAVNITVWGGGVITLGDGNQNYNLQPLPHSISMNYSMEARNFDTSTGPETLQWTLTGDANNKMTLSIDNYEGPLTGADAENKFSLNLKDENSNHLIGVTDYGTYVDEYNPAASNASELTLIVPQVQVLAQVYLIMGVPNTTNPPPQLCGNGHIDSGETCHTCPADAGVCHTNAGGGGGGGGGAAPVTLSTKSGVHTIAKSGSYDFSLPGALGTHHITISSIDEDSVTFLVQSTSKSVTLTKGESQNIDITNDGTPDITISLSSFTNTTATFRLAIFNASTEKPIVADSVPVKETEQTVVPPEPTKPVVPSAAVVSSADVSNLVTGAVIAETPTLKHSWAVGMLVLVLLGFALFSFVKRRK